MIKNFFCKAKIFLFAILVFLISSCKFFSETFNEPVKEYFKEYTESAGIMRYEISKGEVNQSENGKIFISSSQNAQIIFYLRNPQNYKFSSADINLDFAELDNSLIEKTLKNPAEKSLVQISQSSDDLMILKLEYPSEFLLQTETGFEISPQITLSHPISKIPFAKFQDLKLYSNSPPPQIYGATVYKNPSTNKYVLLFNLPEKSLLKGIHQDICEISIFSSLSGETSSQILIDLENGTFNFENSSFGVGDVSGNYEKSSVDFVQKGQAAYFFTNDFISDENTNYTITLKDKDSLFSQVQTSVYSVKLGDVQVFDSSGKLISSGDYLEQDDGSSFATVSFKLAENSTDEKTGQIFNTADSFVIYEIYQGQNSNGKLLLSGKNSGGELTLQIPSGEIFVRVYSHKDLFVDSDVKEYSLNVLKSTIYVSPNGSDDFNNGSASSPYATISKAIKEFSNIEKRAIVYLEGDILDSPELSVANANLIIHANGHSISDFTMQTSGTFVADNLSLTGKLSVSSGNLAFDGGLVNAAEVSGGIVEFSDVSLESVTLSGGSLSLDDSSVAGNVNLISGSANFTNTSVSGVKISGGTLQGNNLNVSGATEVLGGSVAVSNSSVAGVAISSGSANFINTSVSGNIIYSGGTLSLEGSTKVLSSSKILMSPNLEISVKNLSENFVANLASENSFDTWQKGTAILNFENDNQISASQTVQKFILDSSKWNLIADSSGKKGVLETSEASLEIKEFEVEFFADSTKIVQGKDFTLNVNPSVKLKSTGETFNFELADFTDWNLSLYFQNVQVQSSSSSQIAISKDYPAGTYTLKISARYNKIYYNSTQEIILTEAIKWNLKRKKIVGFWFF